MLASDDVLLLDSFSDFEYDISYPYQRISDFLSLHHGDKPVLLNFPHSGRCYPQEHLKFINQTFHNDIRIFEDPYLDLLIPEIQKINTSILINHYPRIFIDVNRSINKKSDPIINGESIGLIPFSFPNGKLLYRHPLHNMHRENRIKNYYEPYHQTFKMMIDTMIQDFKTIFVLDCHSMPSVGDKSDPDAFKARPDIILGDNFGRSASPTLVAFLEEMFINQGFSVFRNYPYAGGYITHQYSHQVRGIHSIQIEINRQLYIDEKSYHLKKNAKDLQISFQTVIAQLSRFLEGYG